MSLYLLFLPVRRSKRGMCHDDMAGWLSVACRYCIKTAKPILKLIRPSGSPIILVSSAPIPNSKGNPSAGALNTQGGKNWRFSCDFRWKSPFISETV